MILADIGRLYNSNISIDSWKWTQKKDVPQQANLVDCGLYCLLYAQCIAKSEMIDFQPYHSTFYRHKIAADLLQGINLKRYLVALL
jgi:Ulp1 family protease